MAIKFDTQREACYDWERSIFREERIVLTDDQIYDLVEKACTRYGIKMLDIEMTPPTRRRGYYVPWEHKIQQPDNDWGRRPHIVIHEIAHGIVQHRCGSRVHAAWHGPEFCSVEIALWKACFPALNTTLAKFAGTQQRPRRVRFANSKQTPQPKTRTRLPKFDTPFDAFHAATEEAREAKRAADAAYHEDLAARKADPNYQPRDWRGGD